ncbi:MAG: transcriptional regulator, partial [Bacteroidales bacterium]|nr:transcriptional regulator [Bacteroidales bacterium]
PLIKRKSLLGSINISKATLERIIKQLSSEPLNLIEYKGSLKTGGYVLTEKGDAFVKSVNNDYYG